MRGLHSFHGHFSVPVPNPNPNPNPRPSCAELQNGGWTKEPSESSPLQSHFFFFFVFVFVVFFVFVFVDTLPMAAPFLEGGCFF
jgi:hypothetical protein